MSQKYLTKAEFCEAYCISPSQVERLFKIGLPREKQDGVRDVLIPVPQGATFYHGYLRDLGKKEAQPSNAADAKLRIDLANAEMAELDLAERRKELMTVADYYRLVEEAFTRVRAKLINIPSRLAGVVVNAATAQEAESRLRPIVLEVLDELRRADDVPLSTP